MNNIIKKIILLFLLLSPILDMIVGIELRLFPNAFSIGTLIRGLVFILMIYYLYKNNINRKYLVLFFVYVIMALINTLLNTSNNLFTEISNIIIIFYLPIAIMFFSNLKEEKINDKFLISIYIMYVILLIIPYIFNISHNVYTVKEGKISYIGLFYSGNEISAVLTGLLPVVIYYLYVSKNYIFKIMVLIGVILATLMLGTKTLFIGLIVVLLYYIFKYIKDNFSIIKLKTKVIGLFVLIFVITGTVIIFPKIPVFNNLKIALDYYKVDSISDLASIENIDNIIFSRRLSYLDKINKEYTSGDKITYIYGIGKTKLMNIRDIEIDIFDIFYTIGIFGISMYIILLICSMKNSKLKNQYKFSFYLFILMSLFSGHVLSRPMVSIYIAILFILNNNSICINKKKILLVSNMYPSKKYKHYGSFVKNTKELLEENNFIVDKVTISKHDNKIIKLFSYIYLHSYTFIKGIFNNYDYIYVHFVSHSSFGASLLKSTSKGTKLVLNAHGNDIVSDDGNIKNINRSKKYLKKADIIVVPSKYFKDVVISDYNIDDSKIFIYPSGGVNTSKFINIDMKKAKREANLSPEYNYIGYVSRIEKDKGYDTFLNAISILMKEKEFKKYRFLIIGSGSEKDKFDKIVNDLSIKEYIEERGFVSQDELINIYNSLDIFVFPTYRKSESLGLVGLEAMACETLVIASNNYGPTDYLVDNVNGKFFNPKDPIDLVNKIKEMKNLSNQEIKKIKKNSRETAIKYDVKNTKNLILKVFK